MSLFLGLTDTFWSSVRLIVGNLYTLAVSVGGPGLFVIALADSSFLSLPEGNDILIVVLSTGQGWDLMAYYVMMTTLGSVCGCTLLYLVGRRGGLSLRRRIKEERLQEIEELYQRWGIWAVAIPSILPPPTPFKIFVLSAGLFRIGYSKFLCAVTLGRSVRYFMWGVLAVLYGELVKQFLERHLPTIGTVLFFLLVAAILGYILMWLRARRKSPEQEIA